MKVQGANGAWRVAGLLAASLSLAAGPTAAAQALSATNAAALPIDLPTALRLAGAQNLDVQLARARLREAEANHTSAVEAFFPWVAPGVSYHRRDGMAQAVPAGTISATHFQSYQPGATLAAQWALGDAVYSNLVARQLVRASNQALEQQRQEVTLNAAQGYFDLTQAKALVGVATEALQTSQDYQRELHEAVAAGLAFKGDELRVQTQTEQYRISRRQALERQRVKAAELAQVLHLDPVVELVPQDTGLASLTLFDPNTPETALVQQALRERPDLKQSQAMIAAARQARNGAVYGPLVPSVGAQGFWGGLGGGPDHGPSSFGDSEDYLIGLSWRIGPGGLFDSGRIRGSKARLSAAQLSAAKLEDLVRYQVVAGLTRVRSLSDQIKLAQDKLASAEETLRLTRARKQFGVGLVLEDIQAQQDLNRARADYVSAVAEFNKAQYELSRAVGQIPEPGNPAGAH